MKIYNNRRASKTVRRSFKNQPRYGGLNTKLSGLYQSVSKIFSKIDQNPFQFQIIGISILTVAILISFQSIADFSTTQVKASNSGYEVRMLTNFNVNKVDGQNNGGKIIEIPTQTTKTEVEKKPEPKTYTVKSGDSVSSISQLTKVSQDDILKLNELTDAGVISIGQSLILSN